MMKTSENKVQVGNRQRRAKICKVCGKEGYVTDIMRHIETHHLEGLSISCNLCHKMIRSRNALRAHMIKEHWSTPYHPGQEMKQRDVTEKLIIKW